MRQADEYAPHSGFHAIFMFRFAAQQPACEPHIVRDCCDPPIRARNSPVPRLDLLIVLVLAIVCGAVTASATGQFEPLPLFAGVIVAGILRSVRLARQRG